MANRYFVLRPLGGLAYPRDAEPVRSGYLPTGQGLWAVSAQGDRGRLLVRDGAKVLADEAVGGEAAGAILDSLEPATLSFIERDTEGWKVRIYLEKFWGLVVGQAPVGAPAAPEGFALGQEVTGAIDLAEWKLAACDEAAARELMESVDTSPV